MAVKQQRGLEALSFQAVMVALAVLALVLLVAPTLVVLVVSLTSSYSLRFPPPGYSLKWYVALLDAWQLHFAAWNSLQVAFWTTLLSILFGVAGAAYVTSTALGSLLGGALPTALRTLAPGIDDALTYRLALVAGAACSGLGIPFLLGARQIGRAHV